MKLGYYRLYSLEMLQEQLIGQRRIQTKYDPVELFIRDDHSFSI